MVIASVSVTLSFSQPVIGLIFGFKELNWVLNVFIRIKHNNDYSREDFQLLQIPYSGHSTLILAVLDVHGSLVGR